MLAMLCSIWDDFRKWVTVDWTATTYAIVMAIMAVLGLLAFLSFFKGSFDKGKNPKWLKLILTIVIFVLIGVLAYARFA